MYLISAGVGFSHGRGAPHGLSLGENISSSGQRCTKSSPNLCFGDELPDEQTTRPLNAFYQEARIMHRAAYDFSILQVLLRSIVMHQWCHKGTRCPADQEQPSGIFGRQYPQVLKGSSIILARFFSILSASVPHKPIRKQD
jgi:hypothetical protein